MTRCAKMSADAVCERRGLAGCNPQRGRSTPYGFGQAPGLRPQLQRVSAFLAGPLPPPPPLHSSLYPSLPFFGSRFRDSPPRLEKPLRRPRLGHGPRVVLVQHVALHERVVASAELPRVDRWRPRGEWLAPHEARVAGPADQLQPRRRGGRVARRARRARQGGEALPWAARRAARLLPNVRGDLGPRALLVGPQVSKRSPCLGEMDDLAAVALEAYGPGSDGGLLRPRVGPAGTIPRVCSRRPCRWHPAEVVRVLQVRQRRRRGARRRSGPLSEACDVLRGLVVRTRRRYRQRCRHASLRFGLARRWRCGHRLARRRALQGCRVHGLPHREHGSGGGRQRGVGVWSAARQGRASERGGVKGSSQRDSASASFTPIAV